MFCDGLVPRGIDHVEMERMISDGQSRLLKDPATREKISKATSEIEGRFRREMAGVGILGKIKLLIRMKKAIRKTRESIAPSSGCYLKT